VLKDRERRAREQHAHRASKVLALRPHSACRRVVRRARSAASALAAATAYARRQQHRVDTDPMLRGEAVIVASTGPAHGTNTRPRLTPSGPAAEIAAARLVMKASGRRAGMRSEGRAATRSTKSSAIAMLRSTSCGSRAPTGSMRRRVKRELATRPAMIANGRRPSRWHRRRARSADRENARRHRGDHACEKTDPEQDDIAKPIRGFLRGD